MHRHALLLVAAPLVACAADEYIPPSSDARVVDASDPDATAIDAGICVTSFPACATAPTPDPSVCAAAVPLEPGTPRTGQDSATGGYGDCAMSGSGLGGPSLYYRVTIPPDRIARIAVDPSTPAQDGLVRAFSTCADTTSLHSGRGGMSTQGRAAICVPNADTVAHEYVIAVSRYSGESACVPLTFDVSIDLRLPADGCQEIE